jgi:hypothetical protein
MGKYCEQNTQQNKNRIKNKEENVKEEECLLDCSKHGICILIKNNEKKRDTQQCKCLPGWTGINCQIGIRIYFIKSSFLNRTLPKKLFFKWSMYVKCKKRRWW